MKVFLFVLMLGTISGRRYKAEWKDLDTRPLPQWYDEAKVGVMLHWGVYSVPSFKSEWFWDNWENGKADYVTFMKNNYRPNFNYADFAPMFTAEFFDPRAWAELFYRAGVKYVVLTTKHHEGFTLFPSHRSFTWNAKETGPRLDIVKELGKAVKAKGLKFGTYHSLFEWFNPIYLEDKQAKFKTDVFPTTKLMPDLKQLVNDYKTSIIWSDGDWEAYDSYWNSTGFLAWLYNDSPVKDEVVVNDRWGIGTGCTHGDFYNCRDQYNPGELQHHKWENAFPLDKRSWGYRRRINVGDVISMEDLLDQVASTVSCGGNVLINAGPTKEGTIPAIFQDRLQRLGRWLAVNGAAVYATSPWLHQNDSLHGKVWYTCTKTVYNPHHPTAVPDTADTVTAIYAIVLQWPKDNILRVKDISPYLQDHTVAMLGEKDELKWDVSNGIASIEFPSRATVYSDHAWALKFTTN